MERNEWFQSCPCRPAQSEGGRWEAHGWPSATAGLSSPVPPVPLRFGSSLAVMGGLGEEFHVRGGVGAAFGEGHDVVYLRSCRDALKAALSKELLLG